MLLKKWIPSLLLLITLSGSAQTLQSDILHAAQHLVDSFTLLQSKQAMLDFSDTARLKWNNLPVGLRARSGVSVGSLTDGQRRLLHRLLYASLSSQGYLKATSIMHLDNLLNMYVDLMHEQKSIPDSDYKFLRDLKWSHQNYFLAFFGKPQAQGDWGYKLEGHHLSINFTFHDQQLSVTPMFVGTDPAEFPITEYAGWRVLGKEEDFGLGLINALSDSQRKMATMSSEVPGDIITAAESGKRLVDYWGIKGDQLNKEQRALLTSVVREFIFNLAYEKAVEEYDKVLKAGIENIYFGWIGSYNEKEPHYYILNGPGFLIEFDNNGGPRRAANHIHAIWREKGNEFGGDVLKKHYESEHKRSN